MNAPRSLTLGIALIASISLVGLLTWSSPVDAQDQRPPAPVQVTNTAASAVPVYDVSRVATERFQHGTVNTSFASSSSSAEVVTVPAGKRLVIEHWSAWVNATGPDGLASITLGLASAGPFDQALCLPLGQTANGLNHFFQCSSTTQLVAEAGQTVRFFVSVANSNGGFHRAFVSGYYEPAP